MYREFAAVYDRLMADVDYAAWAARYREMLLERGISDGARVLEAACGTGNLSLHLAKHYLLLPCDLSSEMLSIAARKAKSTGLSLDFSLQDLRSLRAHRTLDAIIAGNDGVNYLLTLPALRAFAASAFRALRPGGVLAFDVSSQDKLSRVLGGGTQVLRSDDICYIWENAWDSKTSRLAMSLTIFSRDSDGRYTRVEEEQVQRAWTAEELTGALVDAGFERVGVTGNLTARPPQPGAQRLHIAAQKPEGSYSCLNP